MHLQPHLLRKELLQLDQQKQIKFIVLFGSVAEGRANKLSDIDLAVYYGGTPDERFQFRKKALGLLPKRIDLHIFQDLPLAVRKEVLRGKLLYYQDFQFVFDEYMKVIREYDSFEKYQNEYVAALESARITHGT